MKGKPERFLIAAVLAVFSYEWLVSGLNKLLTRDYVSSLHAEMLDNLSNIHILLYRTFLRTFGVAHCTLLAILVEAAELCVGLSFAFLVVQILRGRIGRNLMKLGIFSCAVAIFMNLNFLFYESGAVFISIGDPFDEGVSIDFIMTLIECGLSLYLWSLLGTEVAKHRPSRFITAGKKLQTQGR